MSLGTEYAWPRWLFPRDNIELALGGTLGLPDAATAELFARAALYATLPIVRLFARYGAH